MASPPMFDAATETELHVVEEEGVQSQPDLEMPYNQSSHSPLNVFIEGRLPEEVNMQQYLRESRRVKRLSHVHRLKQK